MELNEAMIILKAHRNWLADKKNLPKTIDAKVIKAIQVVEKQVKNIAYEPVLSAGLCDNCQIPKMENSGDGVSEPLNPVLWCSKQQLVVEPLPEPSERVNKCEFFKPCT